MPAAVRALAAAAAAAALLLLLLLPAALPQPAPPAPTQTDRGGAGCSQRTSVWLSELRPSEDGMDLELTALAGTNLARWSLVGYDSNTGSCGSCARTEVFLFTRTTVVPD